MSTRSLNVSERGLRPGRGMQLGCPVAFALLGLLSLGACLDDGGDRFAAGVVLPTDAPFGPSVVFDPLALPVPEVPLPNDLLLERDPAGSGSLQWNVSTRAPTRLEREIRADLARLDGFGSFGPITVAFDAPLDLDTVNAATVRVVNITRGHPDEGREVTLDLGRGAFPLAGRGSYWPFDPLADAPNFLLAPDNLAEVDGVEKLVEHYEVETNTLLVRPRDALPPGCTFAVLLTRGILGAKPEADAAPETEGRPIRSPFPFKAHAAQAPLVARALRDIGLPQDELAFGWTFTTGRPAERLTRVREGLHGRGELAELSALVPPTLGVVRDTGIPHDADGRTYPANPRDHRFIVQGAFLDAILGLFLGLADGFSTELGHVSHIAFGSFPSVDVRTPDRAIFDPDGHGGRTVDVPYLVAVPRETERHAPPFPVVIYFHGTGSSRFEFLSLANNLARQGLATVAFDQVGHGPIVPDIRSLLSDQGIGPEAVGFFIPLLADLLAPDRVDEFEGLTFDEALEAFNEIGLFAELATIGRTEDADGDGALQSGESFFHADPFKQCAAFQQDLVDLFALVRALRALDPLAVPAALEDPATASDDALLSHALAGDFDADGRLDLGGPEVPIGLAGISLGGFHALMGAAVEPEVSTTSPIAAGGGVADILLRSSLRQITRIIYLDVFGPLVVGCPDGVGGVWLSLNNESGGCGRDLGALSFGRLDSIDAGSVVMVENLDNGETTEHPVLEDGAGFAVPVPADRWDQLRVSISRPDGSVGAVYVLTPWQGLGLQRNSPDLRRFVTITQHALDACDPIAFARHIFRAPLPGHRPKQVLFENVAGDATVPISTGIALARAAGVLGVGERADGWVDTLVEIGAVRGDDLDVDGVTVALGLADGGPANVGPIPPVESGDGVSALRFAFARKRHEWVAGPTNGALYDAHTLSRNRIAIFHASGGRVVTDDMCIVDESCALLDTPEAWPGTATPPEP